MVCALDRPVRRQPEGPSPDGHLATEDLAGIGLGYNQFNVDVDVEKDSFNGSLDWTYEGPMLYYSASF